MSDDTLPVLAPDIGWEDAQAILEDHDLGDGLPLVPPTRARLDAMLNGVSEPETSYGTLMPMYGDLTPVAVAYQCVLAGCWPEHLPIVLSALTACTEDAFNLLGIATTTGTPAVAVVVHGDIVRTADFNASSNCLGPGNRANAAVGRAVGLSLRNIGGARPGVGDMATMGQPGKLGWCFAEAPSGPFPPYGEPQGFAAGAAAVTVLGVSGSAEVLPGNQESAEAILLPMAASMRAAQAASGGAREREGIPQVALIPPELVENLHRHGWDLPRVRHFLNEARAIELSPALAQWPSYDERALCAADEDIHVVVTGGPGVKMTHLPLWSGGTVPVTRAILSL